MSHTYQRHRRRAGQRQAEISKAGRDIGMLDPPADPKRRRAAEQSLRTFCETYFPQRFTLEWSADHLRVIDRIETTIADGSKLALAMPRASGKTTLLECAAIWAVLTGRSRFVMLIGATADGAAEVLNSIRGELEGNDLLASDFQEACGPIRALEGIHNRSKGQLHNGERTRIRWVDDLLVLPTIRFHRDELPAGRKKAMAGRLSAASGAIICVRGLLGHVRGAKFRRSDGEAVRPDFILIDDPQSDESATSPAGCEKRHRILSGAIAGLAGPGKRCACFALVTVVAADDLSSRLLDPKTAPQWHGERCKMVYAWPAATTLWEQYAEVRREDLAAGGNGSKATTFYAEHREEMDEGAQVAWPARFNPDELSALQHAYNLRIDSPVAFAAEYQNEPLAVESSGITMLPAASIARLTNGYDRRQVAPTIERLTLFVDVHAQLLYWALCGWGPHFTGHVLDYGTFPDQRATYFAMRDARHTIARHPQVTATTQEGRLSQALDLLFRQLTERRLTRDDGIEMPINLALVDAQWMTDTVYDFCRQARRKYGVTVLPSHGVSFGPGRKPISRWERRRGSGVIGEDWVLPPPARGRGIRHVTSDSDRRKSFLHRRLLTPPGDPGSLTLFHAGPHVHQLIAEHLTAEAGTQVAGPWGEQTIWRAIPNRDNHWLDCLSGCCTAESILGGRVQTGMAGAVVGDIATPGDVGPSESGAPSPAKPTPHGKPTPQGRKPRQRVFYPEW